MNGKINDSSPTTRFAATCVLFAAANAFPFLWTKGAYRSDGYQIAGFPFRFYELGGFAGTTMFSIWALLGNVVVAILIAALVATFANPVLSED